MDDILWKGRPLSALSDEELAKAERDTERFFHHMLHSPTRAAAKCLPRAFDGCLAISAEKARRSPS